MHEARLALQEGGFEGHGKSRKPPAAEPRRKRMQAAGGATLDSRPQSMAAASGLSWAHSKESRASTASTAAAATTRPSEESEHEHSF